MRVLALDTSTPRAIVAAVEDGSLLHVVTSEKQTTHAERLLGMVQAVLEASGWGEAGTELVAVGAGPGSFTGVRVAVATAKGWAFARKLPLIGVATLDAMAHSGFARLGGSAGVAMLDARKGEVFAAMLDASGRRLVEPAHLPRGEAMGWLERAQFSTGKTCSWVVGEVSDAVGLPAGLVSRSAETDLPSPLAMAELASRRWQHDGRDELISLEPLYVRPPDITHPAAKSTRGPGND